LAQAPEPFDRILWLNKMLLRNKKKGPNNRAKEYMKIADQKARETRKAADRGDAKGLEGS
jgi:hypothetical protein